MGTEILPEVRRRYEFLAQVFQALAHPIRVAIVDLLRDGEVCVCDIAGQIGAERSNVSRHLAVMQRAGVLSSRKDGLQVLYRVRTPCILEFFSCATRVARRNVEEDARAFGTGRAPSGDPGLRAPRELKAKETHR